jgi:PhnB protein
MTDPFDVLSTPVEPQVPRPAFARDLRARLVDAHGLDPADAVPGVELPARSAPASTRAAASTRGASVASGLVPYLTVSAGPAALEWYAEALGAVEELRVVGDDGRIGHAELTLGDLRMMLSDEYPEMGVLSPETLGGTSSALHLTVPDVDAAFARAVAAGATVLSEPGDQVHGHRQASLLDPFGHRWMLSQVVEELDVGAYAERSRGTGFDVVGTRPGDRVTAASRQGSGGGIWAVATYRDAVAGIRQLVEVFGFEEQIVVVGPDGTTVHHSELRWPEGGVVQAATYDPANPHTAEPGTSSLYVVTADPWSVFARCEAAGVEVDRPPYAPDYDPDGMGFVVRDREGNLWSFGTYGGQAS